MVKFGEDVERELRTQVIQAREVKPGVFGKDSVLNNIINLIIIKIQTVCGQYTMR